MTVAEVLTRLAQVGALVEATLLTDDLCETALEGASELVGECSSMTLGLHEFLATNCPEVLEHIVGAWMIGCDPDEPVDDLAVAPIDSRD